MENHIDPAPAEAQTPTPTITPALSGFKQLKADLHAALEPASHLPDAERLAAQADILDRAFRFLLISGTDPRHPDLHDVLAALKAQNQCRHTLAAMRTLLPPPPETKT